jgi:hypothetical protein
MPTKEAGPEKDSKNPANSKKKDEGYPGSSVDASRCRGLCGVQLGGLKRQI